mgnify:CR=1 FL=1
MRSLTPYERIKAMVAGREVDPSGRKRLENIFHQDDGVVSDSVKAHVAFPEKHVERNFGCITDRLQV